MNKIILNGKEYPLLFNGTAMFSTRDICGEKGVVEVTVDDTVAAFEVLCKVAVIMAEQGELLRRWEGHDPQEILTENELRLTITPRGILALKKAVAEAVTEGYRREIKDENGEIDLGLAELNKKKDRK